MAMFLSGHYPREFRQLKRVKGLLEGFSFSFTPLSTFWNYVLFFINLSEGEDIIPGGVRRRKEQAVGR